MAAGPCLKHCDTEPTPVPVSSLGGYRNGQVSEYRRRTLGGGQLSRASQCILSSKYRVTGHTTPPRLLIICWIHGGRSSVRGARPNARTRQALPNTSVNVAELRAVSDSAKISHTKANIIHDSIRATFL